MRERIYRFDPHGNEYDKKGKRKPRMTYYQDGYEFVEEKLEGEHRTPDAYPYNHDTFWIWHDEKVEGELWGAEHADRLLSFEGYADRYKTVLAEITAAREGKGFSKFDLTREETQRLIEVVHEGRSVAKGLAMSCNHSSGYPIAVFYYMEKEKT